MEQQSDEWIEARRGFCTASCFADVLAKGEGKTRKAYMLKLVSERLTGKVIESYSNAHMERGNEQEPLARMAYEALTGNLVDEVGFIPHSTLRAGYSPDGHVDCNGGIEIKSVIPTSQIETIRKGGYPSCHRAQIQGSMWVSGRQWWDFVSFSPDLPDNLSLYVFRVERDEEYIQTLELEVIRFLQEAEELYQQLLAWGE